MSRPAGKQSLRLWLRLLACTNRVDAHVRTRLREGFGMTLPQFDVLAELDAADTPQSMSDLSRRLMVSNGNVTGVVERLARAGLVERQAQAGDRRVQKIALTPAGRARFATVAAAHEAWVADLFADLGARERDQLVTLLNGAKTAIQARLDASGAASGSSRS